MIRPSSRLSSAFSLCLIVVAMLSVALVSRSTAAEGSPSLPTAGVVNARSTGVHTVLYMRVAFPDTRKEMSSEAGAYADMKQVNDFYVEQSYGKLSFLTTVTPLLVLPHPESYYNDDLFGMRTDAMAIANSMGYITTGFEHTITAFTGSPGSFGGWAPAYNIIFIKRTGWDIIAHEMGHCINLSHSSSWNTGGKSVIGDGSFSEYGDYYDVMASSGSLGAHFNTFQKNKLNWLPTASAVSAFSGNGVYRIAAMDQPVLEQAKRYAVKIPKDNPLKFEAARDARAYWLEFRQHPVITNAWTNNAILLHWSSWASSWGPDLLDTTPGSPDGFADSPLVIGRTFSDLEAGIHITPLGKAGTTPESMDVMVNVGAFPGNLPPTATLYAGATSVAVGAEVQLMVDANDLDHDQLSFAWDFGDKTFSTNNSASVTKSWSVAGDYSVRCVVSDMKGGTCSRSILIHVGTTSTYTVSGRVTLLGQPVANARVHNGLAGGNYRGTYTDQDGNYTITNLASGTYTFGATLDGYNFPAVGFTNPLVVTSNQSEINFNGDNQVTLVASDPNATEGISDSGAFTLTRSGSTAAPLTVYLSSPCGSALYTTDYTFTPSLTAFTDGIDSLTIPAGQASLNVSLDALVDGLTEGPEEFTISISPNPNYKAGSDSSATFVIQDANSALPRVSIQAVVQNASEDGSPGKFTISRTGSTAASLSVSFSVSGTATDGSDFTSLGTQVTIPTGQSSVDLPLIPIDDNLIEGMETVIVTISSDAGYLRSAVAGDYTATVNLADNDLPNVSVMAADSTATEAGNNVGVFVITRTGDLSNPLTVSYALGGSAQHGVDYLPLSGVLIIPAGASAGTVSIVPINDAWGEPVQTVSLQLISNTTYQVANPSFATLSITDDGDLPAISINLSDSTISEPGTGTAKIRFSSTGTGMGNVTVYYTLSGTATNGVDYTTLSGSVSVPINGAADLVVTALNDTFMEGDESIIVTLTPNPAYQLSIDKSVTLNLVDDDGTAVSVVYDSSQTAFENGGNLGFKISRTGATTDALTVNYTMGGTAINGVDYTTLSGVATIPAGQSGVIVPASGIADAEAEVAETVIMQLSASADYGLALASATHYIIESQTPTVQVRFSTTSGTGSENVGAVAIPVTLSAAATVPITVEYGLAIGTAYPGADFNTNPGTLTFLPGETTKNILLEIADDGLIESSETVKVVLRNAINASLGTSTYTYTITDNDVAPTPQINFTSVTSNSLESVTAPQVYVCLSATATSTVTVDYAVSGGTATAEADYTISVGSLSFAVGETVKALPLTVIDDSLAEANETITFSISVPSGATLGSNTSHTLTIIDNDTATVTIAATTPNAAELGNVPGTFTITRTGPTTAALTVNLSVGGTANNVSDYTAIGNTVSIPAGMASAQLTVSPIEDALDEGSETVTLTLVNGASYTVGASSAAAVTIADGDAGGVKVFITTSDAVASEPGTDIGTFTLTRTGATINALTVNLAVSGTASSGTDYTALPNTVTFAIGASTAILTAEPLNDAEVEYDETVAVTVTSGTGYVTPPAPMSSATVTIVDDEAVISIAASDASASELDLDPGTFAVTRSGTAVSALTVDLAVSGTATAGADYVALDTAITFQAGETTKNITVTPVNDSIAEGVETVIVSVASGAGYAGGSSSSATVNIGDDEVAISIQATKPTTIEGGTGAAAGEFTITRTGNTTGSTTVNLTFAGTAAVVTDYATIASTVTFTAGQANKTITVTSVNDPDYEGDETVIMTIAAGVGYELGSPSSATVTIVDNDKPTASVAVDVTSLTEGGSGAVLTFTRTGITTLGPLSVNYAMTGAATNGSDYAWLSGTVVIAQGQASASVPVSVLQDSVTEAPETVIATISANATVYNVAAAPNNAVTMTITDDNEAVLVNVAATDGVASEPAKSDGTGTFTITRSGSVSSAITVNLLATGTATAGSDYTAIPATVTIPVGQSSATVTVTPLDDSEAELDETVILNLLAGTGYTVGATPAATVNLYDDEPVQIRVEVTDPLCAEATTADVGTFTLRRLGLRTSALTINYTVSGTATSGTDYTALTGTAALAANATSVAVTVTPINDALVEGTETVALTLAAGTGYTVNTQNSGIIEIRDDETVDVNLTFNDETCIEKATPDTGTFRITRTATAVTPLDVTYTLSGTAINGTDYVALSGTATIPANATTIDVVVTPIDDAILEGAESVIMTLTGGGATYDVGNTRTQTLLIQDDDVPTITTAATDGTAAEADGGTTNPGLYTFTASVAPASDLTINYTVSGGTNGADYNYLPGSIVLPAGQTMMTLPLIPVDDELPEGAENIYLNLAAGVNYNVGTTSSVTVVIAASDTPVATIEAVDPNAAENPLDKGTFVVTLSKAVASNTTVTYVVGGTATGSSDYTALSGSVTVSAGTNTAILTVTPINDTISEGPESVTVTLASSASYTLGAAKTSTVTIADDDYVPAIVTWKQTNFGLNSNNEMIAGDLADPDGDGLCNLQEYAFGNDPNSPASAATQVGLSSGSLQITFNRMTANTDVAITVQAADSLNGAWTDIASSVNGATTNALVAGVSVAESGTGASRTVQVTDLYSSNDSAHPRRFMRIIITH